MTALAHIDLRSFALAWMAHPEFAPPDEPHEIAGPHVGMTLYRDSRHQVQFWICPPHSLIGEHAHPHAEGYAVRVAGDIDFKVNGKRARPMIGALGAFPGMRTPMVHVPAGAKHSARIGAQGASFLAITKWDGIEPLSVHLDWAGEPLDEAHKAALGRT